MTINFQPDVCLPKDPAGFGLWLAGHYYEHVTMRQRAALISPPQNVPDYDIYSWSDDPQFVTGWLSNHQTIHTVLRSGANLTGIDLSQVDLTDDEQFAEWMDDHSQEHIALRSFYGIT